MDLAKAYDKAADKAERVINDCYPTHRHQEPEVKKEKRNIFIREYLIITGLKER